MSKYGYLVFFLIIISCGLQSKRENNKKVNSNLQLYINTYDIGQDSILIKTFIVFPTSNLVFIKQDEKFQASIETSLRLEDSDTGIQIKRISDVNKIIKKYYEDTRTSELHQLEYDFLLKKDDYKITANIKDLDSFNVWDTSTNIDFSNQDLVLFSYNESRTDKKYFLDGLSKELDTLWIEIPKYQFKVNDYEYTILRNDSTLTTAHIKDCIPKNNNLNSLLLECPIVILDDVSGNIEIRINSKLNKVFSSSISIHKESSLWSSDIDVILGVMSYILSYSDIKTLYKLAKEDQLVFISEYISNKDLDLETNENEFLELIKTRYQYANINFSQHNVGWKTDRGEIYIINGPPKSIDFMYDNIKMANKEIWHYEDKIFMFSDERTLGELRLVNQF